MYEMRTGTSRLRTWHWWQKPLCR